MAAYDNANFPGDETTDWTHSSGIKSTVSDMLNRAVGGAVGSGVHTPWSYDQQTVDIYDGLSKDQRSVQRRPLHTGGGAARQAALLLPLRHDAVSSILKRREADLDTPFFCAELGCDVVLLPLCT